MDASEDAAALRRRIKALEEENARLRRRVGAEEAEEAEPAPVEAQAPPGVPASRFAMGAREIGRYSRHLLLPSFGVEAQKRLMQGSALVVGAGGLGAPALLYLAAAGVGRIGVVDHDRVSVSNLHRQVIHTEARAGDNKAESAAAAMRALDSAACVETHVVKLTPDTALDLVSGYGVVVDATDNPASRYIISDACVLAGTPLVSAAALGTDGQISVYNHDGGPCYRCVHPEPPPQMAVTSCADGGVLGPVPGLMGCWQAIEAIKVLAGVGKPMVSKLGIVDVMAPRFTVVKLRGRRRDCAACGEAPTVTGMADTARWLRARGLVTDEEEGSCAANRRRAAEEAPLREGEEVSAWEAATALSLPGARPWLLLDVREGHQFAICSLEGSVNVPLRTLAAEGGAAAVGQLAQGRPVLAVCRRGIDSQRACRLLADAGLDARHMRGGLQAWQAEVDPTFPAY